MSKRFLIVILFLTLAACSSKRTEMPTNESGGSDEMRQSPCACNQLEDYNGSGFEWRG